MFNHFFLGNFIKNLNFIPMGKHGKQIKDDEKYEALRREGASKEKAARIANTPDSGKKGGKASNLEDRTKKELLEEAKKIGIKNRHSMKKEELIKEIRK